MSSKADVAAGRRLWVIAAVAVAILGLIVFVGVLYGRSLVNELSEGFLRGPVTIPVSGVLEVTVPAGYIAQDSIRVDAPESMSLMIESVKVFPDSLYSMAAIEEPPLWVAAFSPDLSDEVVTAWQSGYEYSVELGSMDADWEWRGTKSSDTSTADASWMGVMRYRDVVVVIWIEGALLEGEQDSLALMVERFTREN